MIQNLFSILLEANELLGSTKARDAISTMKDAYEKKLYFVAFTGQFSAGKSTLLNSLLGRKILPQGTTETTPSLTYIRFGNRENAKLHYLDGSVQVIELSEVAQLAQQNLDNRWELDELDYLEVFLNEEMLRTGMILLDTPGINTMIERHESLLSTSLSLASNIVYIAGHAPAQLDVDKLNLFAASGLDTIFVRTHCDEIKASEESMEQVVAADLKILRPCGIGEERCYHVSNESTSALFSAIEPLRRKLTERGCHAQEELEKATEQQLLVFAKQCRAQLEERRALLSAAKEKNSKELENRRQQALKKIELLESQLKQGEDTLRKRVEDSRRILKGEIEQQLEQIIAQQGDRISNSTITDEAAMKAQMCREAAAFAQDAFQLINCSMDPLVQKINGELEIDGLSLDAIAIPLVENYQELCVAQNDSIVQLQNQLAALRSNHDQIEQGLQAKAGSPEYFQLQKELIELEGEILKAKQECNDLPLYIPQLIEVDDDHLQPSQIAGTLGMVADWAMLLIPGAAWASGIEKLGKIPKVHKAIARIFGTVEKAGKIIKKGDTVKDTLYALQNMSKTYATAKRKGQATKVIGEIAQGAGKGVEVLNSARRVNESGSILDMLTVEHWARKIGGHFDHPPRFVADREYEEQYKKARRALEQTQRELQQQEYQKRAALGMFKDEEERLQAQKESLIVAEASIEKKLAMQKAQIKETAERAALQKWRRVCGSWYQEQLRAQLHEIVEEYIKELPDRLEEYRKSSFQSIRDALEKEQDIYLTLENSSADDVVKEMEQVDALLKALPDNK